MTLATRCTACHTVFRVVQDQLKVSDGWVRCGRCNEVFDASSNLIDLHPSQGFEPPTLVAALPSSFVADDTHRTTPLPHIVEQPLAEPGDAPTPFPQATDTTLQAVDIELAPGEGDGVEPADKTAEAALNGANPALRKTDADPTEPTWDVPPKASADQHPAAAAEVAAAALPEPDLRADVLPTPSFVRQADRAARWQTRGARVGLVAASIVLALTLVVQLMVWQRDVVAAHWKEARSALVTLCGWVDCQVQPLRRVDQLSVASSGLTRIEGSSLHRFNVSLLNRGSTELMLPAIDLSLTDAQGQVIARRVLAASELGVTAAAVAAGAELPLQAMLSTGSRKVAGYTIELFYP
jgi:predicted Zn finger-like uncharacterized protein